MIICMIEFGEYFNFVCLLIEFGDFFSFKMTADGAKVSEDGIIETFNNDDEALAYKQETH